MSSMIVLMIRRESSVNLNEIVASIELYGHDDSFLLSVKDRLAKSDEKGSELMQFGRFTSMSDKEEFLKHYYVGDRQEIVDYIMKKNPTTVQVQRFAATDHYRTYMTFFWQ